MTTPEIAALLKKRQEIDKKLEAAIALDWLRQFGAHPSHKVTIVLGEGSAVGGSREAATYLARIAQEFLTDIANRALNEASNTIGAKP